MPQHPSRTPLDTRERCRPFNSTSCIKFVGDHGLIHRVFADKKPFKGKEVHFADSQMYRNKKEEKEEKITSFAGNRQKDKGKAPPQSPEENKPSDKPKESNQSPFVVSFKSSKPLVITTKAKKTKQKTRSKLDVSFVSIIQDTDSDSETEDDTSSSQANVQQVRHALTPLETLADVEDPASTTFIVPAITAEEKPIFLNRSDASSSNSLLKPFQNASTSRADEDIDLPGYLFEKLPDKDPGSLSNWYDFSNDEEELSDDTDARFSDLEEPSSPKEVPYFNPISAEGLIELEASENIVEEPPLNLPTKDSVQKIDLGTPDNPRPIFISKNIKDDALPEYVSFLREFVNCFAWSYTEIPDLDPKIAIHKLNLQENIKPIKQGQRRLCPNVMDKIEQEVQKLKNVGFIHEEQHPEWLIVPVTKKNGQIRVCIDYRDLNNACPKDEFPLPIPEVMIDNTCGFEEMTFMDGFSGYNQIKMHPEDEKNTSFRTPFGVYCYTVMPFGLKNFRYNKLEGYDEDIPRYAAEDGRMLCKFLGFIVRKAGIELDPTKVKAILEMSSPRTLRELKGLQGRLAYIRRFISNLSGKCRPFSRLMKKCVDFVWDAECEYAFQDIKSYLTKPPVLAAPTTGKPFILYTRALYYSLGALLA
ncbi:hypothetical protein AAC387_Pa08g1224 [Persea americana]